MSRRIRRWLLAALFAAGPVAADHVAIAQGAPSAQASQPGTVTLPLAEYDRLVDLAGKPPTPSALPPIAAVVARADLTVRATPESARGTLVFTGEVFQTGPTKVRLVSGVLPLGAHVAGGVAAALHLEQNTFWAIVAGPGPFTITMPWAAEVATEPGRAILTLPTIHAASIRAAIEVAGENADVRVDPGVAARRASGAGHTTLDATIDPGTTPRLSWSLRDGGTRAARDTRMTADVKTLVSLAPGDLRMASLFDVTITQGTPARFDVVLPPGFDYSDLTSGSLDLVAHQDGRVSLAPRDPARRRHQFLVTLERTTAVAEGGAIAMPTLEGVQRETGEIAAEGIGTLDVTADEVEPLHRMDPSEASGTLQALARAPVLAAFRYLRRPGQPVTVTLAVRRFGDAPVLAAVAEHGAATTMVTGEGRSLTEVTLTMRNQARPFLKVGLPKGATLLSASVAGASVKPVEGADGTRVPLLRPGFQPTGTYDVSFVYLDAVDAFARKGDGELTLPSVDVPISVLDWEVFLPDKVRVRRFDGDVIARELMPTGVSRTDAGVGFGVEGGVAGGVVGGLVGGIPDSPPPPPSAAPTQAPPVAPRADQVALRITDRSGAALPGAVVTVTVESSGYRQVFQSDGNGDVLASGVPAGRVTVRAELPGFQGVTRALRGPGTVTTIPMDVGSLSEAVEVEARAAAKPEAPKEIAQAPSTNVQQLQRRLSGVLPVRIDIPRAGRSYYFVRPLVIDEDTTLRFTYTAK